MSSLSETEKKCFEDLFGMHDGTILGTNFDLADLLKAIGVEITSDKYWGRYNLTAAERLRLFWDRQPDLVVGQLLTELLDMVTWHNQIPDKHAAKLEFCQRVTNGLLDKGAAYRNETTFSYAWWTLQQVLYWIMYRDRNIFYVTSEVNVEESYLWLADTYNNIGPTLDQYHKGFSWYENVFAMCPAEVLIDALRTGESELEFIGTNFDYDVTAILSHKNLTAREFIHLEIGMDDEEKQFAFVHRDLPRPSIVSHIGLVTEVQFLKSTVLELWPENGKKGNFQGPKSSAKAASDCYKWLAHKMQSGPKEKTKSDYFEIAQSTFPNLSRHQFDTAWSKSIMENPDCKWNQSGPVRQDKGKVHEPSS